MTSPIVLICFLASAAAAVALMLFLALAGSDKPLPQQEVTARGYVIRRWWFALVTLVAVAAFVVSIPWFPYPSAQDLQTGRHFRVVAQQYSFILPAVVPLNVPVVFDVTAKDVNHGFGIYDPQNRLIAQVQAMPNYVNHMPFKFASPGRYRVRCLEYCGAAHAVMQAIFEVR